MSEVLDNPDLSCWEQNRANGSHEKLRQSVVWYLEPIFLACATKRNSVQVTFTSRRNRAIKSQGTRILDATRRARGLRLTSNESPYLKIYFYFFAYPSAIYTGIMLSTYLPFKTRSR